MSSAEKKAQKAVAQREWLKTDAGLEYLKRKRARRNSPEYRATRAKLYEERYKVSGKKAAAYRNWASRDSSKDSPSCGWARYKEMLSGQGDVCAVCKGKCPTGKRLAVDHDHSTGQVRGLLCSRCNTALGLLRDSPANIGSLLDYLMKFSSRQ